MLVTDGNKHIEVSGEEEEERERTVKREDFENGRGYRLRTIRVRVKDR